MRKVQDISKVASARKLLRYREQYSLNIIIVFLS